ncbi:MAG: DUF402 domain-containing protein [Nocardioides sp.]|nr:DUF402 domain-containing protein [Nocardioides sp.]
MNISGTRPSGEPPFWAPGTPIMWRYGDPDRPHWGTPMTVVQDNADGLVAWLPAGTPVLKVARADGLDFRGDPSTMFTAEREQVVSTWEEYDVLRIAPTGRAWSVWAFFPAGDATFEGWYVNIEDPHVRDEDTTYSTDHVLDVWVEPDRSHGRKDEDELVLAVEQGRYTPDEAAQITSVADEVEAVIAAWGPPFSDGWDSFRPDVAWPVPHLP